MILKEENSRIVDYLSDIDKLSLKLVDMEIEIKDSDKIQILQIYKQSLNTAINQFIKKGIEMGIEKENELLDDLAEVYKILKKYMYMKK